MRLTTYAVILLSIPAIAVADPASDSTEPSVPSGIIYGHPHNLTAHVTERDISFKAPTGNTITGELITGRSTSPAPALLFVHWLGAPETTNHTEFEADAIALAKHGATSLLIDAMWSKPNWFDHVGVDASADLDEGKAQVADIRQSLSVLLAQPNVDSMRVAYVGHDFGAMYGALLAGTDPRPAYYVFVAGTATLQEWYLLEHKAKDEAAYSQAISPLDIVGSLKQAKAKSFLFQFAANDHYIAPERAQLFSDAAPLPKAIFWYAGGHAMTSSVTFEDRQAWLLEKLYSH